MHLPHHLVRTASGLFHFRLKVPADLRATVGLCIIKISLRTRDPKQAQVCSYALSVRYAQAFAEHRGTVLPKLPPSLKDIQSSADHGAIRPYELAVDPISRAITLKTDGTAQDHANGMDALERIGTIFPHMIKPEYRAPAVELSKPKIGTGMTLGAAVERYIKTEAPGLKANTWTQRQRAFDSFVTAMGANTKVADIDRSQAASWGTGLINEKRSKRTAGNMVSHAAQLFESLATWGEIPRNDNPVKGVVVLKKKEKDARRKEGYQWEALELDDLKRVFDPANLARTTTEHVRWGALIGLYTGARVGEVAQLFLRDFVIDDGVPCVCFWPDSDGQSQKTEGSQRKVPLHPDLIRLGLWERVERLRKAKEERLFPKMRIDSKAGAGNSISKGMGYYLGTQLNIAPRRKNGTIGFHSLRKNVIQALQGSRLSAERRRAFVGHEHGEVDVHEEHYMRAWTADELASLFPGLRWGEWLEFERLKALLEQSGN